MLKGLPKELSPELLKALCEMGHGDEIVISDANFPAESSNRYCIRLDGVDSVSLLKAILYVIPLDTYVKSNAILMKNEDCDETPLIWKKYEHEILKLENNFSPTIITREDFYKRASKAFVVVQTGEQAPYGNIILKKGVID